jgi:hypothetical protein
MPIIFPDTGRIHACLMERLDWVHILAIGTLVITAGVICAVLLTL